MLSTLKRRILANGLKAVGASQLHRAFSQRHQGVGVIFMLHRVDPRTPASHEFAPNKHLSVTPAFLSRIIKLVRSLDIDIASLDDAIGRIGAPKSRRFAVFALDDGYRDNLLHAYPEFQAADAPFTIYVPSAWPEGHGELWWRVIEEIVKTTGEVKVGIAGLPGVLAATTLAEKTRTYALLRQNLYRLGEAERLEIVRRMARCYGVDIGSVCRNEVMNWDEIRELARDERVTFGSHSCTHAALARLNKGAMQAEFIESRAKIEHVLGRPCLHFAYPYGDVLSVGRREVREADRAGYRSAVTTTRGLVFAQHRLALTALPRLPLEGDLQDERIVEVQLAGALFTLRASFSNFRQQRVSQWDQNDG